MIDRLQEAKESQFGAELEILFSVLIVCEFGDEVHLLDLVEALGRCGFLLILPPSVDGDLASFARKVFPDRVAHPLSVVVEADLFRSEEIKSPGFDAQFFSQIQEVLPVFFFGVGVVDDHTLSLFQELLGNSIAFFFGFKGVSIDPLVLGHVVLPESRFACPGAAAEYHHFLLYEFDILVFGISEQFFVFGDVGRVEPLYLDFLLVVEEEVLWGFKWDPDIKGELSKVRNHLHVRVGEVFFLAVFVFAPGRVPTVEGARQIYRPVVLDEQLPHLFVRLPADVIAGGDVGVHLDPDGAGDHFDLFLNVFGLGFAQGDALLIGEYDDFEALIAQLLELPGDRLVPVHPIGSILGEKLPALGLNQSAVHVKPGDPLALGGGGAAHYAGVDFLPLPGRYLLLLYTSCFGHGFLSLQKRLRQLILQVIWMKHEEDLQNIQSPNWFKINHQLLSLVIFQADFASIVVHFLEYSKEGIRKVGFSLCFAPLLANSAASKQAFSLV